MENPLTLKVCDCENEAAVSRLGLAQHVTAHDLPPGGLEGNPVKVIAHVRERVRVAVREVARVVGVVKLLESQSYSIVKVIARKRQADC